MNTKILLIALIVLAASAALYVATVRGKVSEAPSANSLLTNESATATITQESSKKQPMQNRIATLTTNKGVIKIELFEDTMPITTGNFIKLAEDKYFDGIKFHRVIDGFMIQSGDPLTNTRGTISMANSGPNSGGSQFFINVADNAFLDFDKQPLQSKHPVFGRVIACMDIVDAISVVPTTGQSAGNRPLEPIVITSLTIGAN